MSVKILLHYYGDVVRKLFLIAGSIMLLGTPVFNRILPVSELVSIGAIAFLAFSAGFTSPTKKSSALFNVCVSLGAFFVFEYYAITTYMIQSHSDPYRIVLFWVDLTLALIFLFAFYYSVKTLRGFFSSE